MHEEAAQHGLNLVLVIGLLGAGVIAVPIFKRIGLGSVLGFLAAGLAVGPYGLRLVSDPESMLHISELGVVLFLFMVGLEMKPSKLWSLRGQILGLGVVQVVLCSAILTAVGILIGLSPIVAFIAGMGFVLTSTAVVMQILQEQRELSTPSGQKIVSILLLEDLAIVPILALVALLSPTEIDESLTERLIAIAIAGGTVAGFVFFGQKLLNYFFRFLVLSGAREIMTAAALFVVLGAAVLMDMSGLSMAMGAFLAGVLLSTSTFRHQLEKDIEPFRDLLLGLFFRVVGMSLDLNDAIYNWQFVTICVIGFMLAKGLAVYVIAGVLGSNRHEAMGRASLMAQGGEFAFVLYTTATTGNLIDANTNSMLTSVVVISMVLTPLTMIGTSRLLKTRFFAAPKVAVDDSAPIIVVGFGRFGKVACQPFLALDRPITIVEKDPALTALGASLDMFTVVNGDGADLDVLRSAGADRAEMIIVCTSTPAETLEIVDLVKANFPLVKVVARAFDNLHAIALTKAGADVQVRELFDSALALSAEAIRELGTPEEEINEIIADVRGRDEEIFEIEMLGGSVKQAVTYVVEEDPPQMPAAERP
jgi:glutathione-regulated potassium-efflux system protein KefB